MKKGSLLDVIFILIIALVLTMATIFGHHLIVEVGDAAGDKLNQTYFDRGEQALEGFDSAFPIIIAISFISLIISVFFTFLTVIVIIVIYAKSRGDSGV